MLVESIPSRIFHEKCLHAVHAIIIIIIIITIHMENQGHDNATSHSLKYLPGMVLKMPTDSVSSKIASALDRWPYKCGNQNKCLQVKVFVPVLLEARDRPTEWGRKRTWENNVSERKRERERERQQFRTAPATETLRIGSVMEGRGQEEGYVGSGGLLGTSWWQTRLEFWES
jgi:hypothetical protein